MKILYATLYGAHIPYNPSAIEFYFKTCRVAHFFIVQENKDIFQNICGSVEEQNADTHLEDEWS